MTKTQRNVIEIEQKILNRMKSESLSRGWKKPSAAKVAPMNLLLKNPSKATMD